MRFSSVVLFLVLFGVLFGVVFFLSTVIVGDVELGFGENSSLNCFLMDSMDF